MAHNESAKDQESVSFDVAVSTSHSSAVMLRELCFCKQKCQGG